MYFDYQLRLIAHLHHCEQLGVHLLHVGSLPPSRPTRQLPGLYYDQQLRLIGDLQHRDQLVLYAMCDGVLSPGGQLG